MAEFARGNWRAGDEPWPLPEARAAMVECARAGEPEWVPLVEALGRVAAADLYAPRALPREARSRMDGYAVAACGLQQARPERPVRRRLLPVVVAAGTASEITVEVDQAVRVLTGAALPSGTDAVVPDEDGRVAGGFLEIAAPVESGDWVQPVGGEVRRGERIVSAGQVLGPALLALCAACGWSRIEVVKRPRVAVLGTGDELLELGQALRGPSHYCNTRLLMQWLVAVQGGRAVNLGNARDEARCVAEILSQVEADAVITTGGTGCGDRDVMREVWKLLGITPVFRALALTPGGHSAFGVKGALGFLAVPGSPWAAEAVFLQLGRPWLRALAGAAAIDDMPLRAVLDQPVINRRSSARVVPGQLCRTSAPARFQPLPAGSDSVFARVLKRQAYLVAPPGSVLEKGCIVAVGLYDSAMDRLISFDR